MFHFLNEISQENSDIKGTSGGYKTSFNPVNTAGLIAKAMERIIEILDTAFDNEKQTTTQLFKVKQILSEIIKFTSIQSDNESKNMLANLNSMFVYCDNQLSLFTSTGDRKYISEVKDKIQWLANFFQSMMENLKQNNV